MDYTNWLKLRRRSLLYDYFCYFDTEARLADKLFEQNGMDVSFLHEFKNANRPFIAVICRTRKKNRERFDDVMNQLKRKMLICGYSDYEAFCIEFDEMCRKTRQEREKSVPVK